jgi:hypothetical protein
MSAELPKPSEQERVFLDDLARERGWSKRKLDYLCADRRLVYWQDVPRGRRYTTTAEIEAFDRAGIRVSPRALAQSNEGRIARLESAVARIQSQISDLKFQSHCVAAQEGQATAEYAEHAEPYPLGSNILLKRRADRERAAS